MQNYTKNAPVITCQGSNNLS